MLLIPEVSSYCIEIFNTPFFYSEVQFEGDFWIPKEYVVWSINGGGWQQGGCRGGICALGLCCNKP